MNNNDEFNFILNRISDFQNTRNTLLTFSFTTVLALIGIAFANFDKALTMPSILYLFPYFLIIPFAARITYFRISDAHWAAYINIFYPEKMRLFRFTNFVKERQRQSFRLISLLFNSEMIILAFACNMLLYTKPINEMLFMLSIILFGIVVFVVYQGYNYGKIKARYKLKWRFARLKFGDDYLEEPKLITIYMCEICKNISNNKSNIISYRKIDDAYDIADIIMQVLVNDQFLNYSIVDESKFKVKFRVKFKFARLVGFDYYFKHFAP